MHVAPTEVPRPYRWSVEDYERAVVRGAFPPHSRIQLIEGELIQMSPQGPSHAGLIDVLADLLRAAYPDFRCRQEKPLLCPPGSEPEPDIAVVRGTARTFLTRHPRAAETILVIEVAVSSLEIDRRKAAIYAQSGVPVYWLIDVEGRRLEVYAAAREGAYPGATILTEDESVAVPGTALHWLVRELLP